MPTLIPPQVATYTTVTPFDTVTVTEGAIDRILISWVGPAGISGRSRGSGRTGTTQTYGPFPTGTVITFTASEGLPSYLVNSPIQSSLVLVTGDITLTAAHLGGIMVRPPSAVTVNITLPLGLVPAQWKGMPIVVYGPGATVAAIVPGAGVTLRLENALATSGTRSVANGTSADLVSLDGADFFLEGRFVT